MALTTLILAKKHLGIGLADTAQDTALGRWIAGASSVMRRKLGRDIGWMCDSYTAAAAAVVTSYGHGLESNATVAVSYSVGTTSLDGSQTVTWASPDTFSVATNTTAGGSTTNTNVACQLIRSYTEYYTGDGTSELVLRQRPVRSITSVYVDGDAYFGEASNAFESGDQLTAGTDFVLHRRTTDTEASTSGVLLRLNNVWPRSTSRIPGLLTEVSGAPIGNIKVTYLAGYKQIPHDLIWATNQLVAEMRRTAESGGGFQSESYDGYSYAMSALNSQTSDAASVREVLADYGGTMRWGHAHA